MNCAKTLIGEDREHYDRKLTLESGESLPDPFGLGENTWTDDISKLPSLSWRDVTEYLIDTPSVFTKESMKAYKSLEAFNYFVSGHVQDCLLHKIGNKSEFCFVKSEVLPSQRQGQKSSSYQVWVCLNKEHGWVLTGHCTCMAGLSSCCSHVAALLFKLEAAVHFKLNEPTACTSQLCSWKASRKRVQPATISSIDFSRPKKHTLPKPFTKQGDSLDIMHYSYMDPTYGQNSISSTEFNELYQLYPSSAVFTSLDPADFIPNVHSIKQFGSCSDTDSDTENDENIIPEPIISLFDPTAIDMAKDELMKYSQSLYNGYLQNNYQKSYDNLWQITKTQAQSRVWMLHRAGRITASLSKQVARMENSPSLINKIMQYDKAVNSKYTNYGKVMEPKAIANFIVEFGKMHDGFNFYTAGLKIDADVPFLGATPDGMVECKCHGVGVLEIKCPYKYRNGFDNWQADKSFPIDSVYNIKMFFLNIRFNYK